VTLLGKPPNGLFHLTAAGATTWHGFSCEIMRLAGLTPLVHRIRTAEYPTAARRPANSLLDNARLRAVAGIVMPAWEESLARCVAQASRARA
jgi:dTDP-4-dehydrorhamnose reductase